MNRLERALNRAKEDESLRPALRRALFDERVVLPLAAVKQVDEETAGIDFRVLEHDGRSFVIAYTNERLLWKNHTPDQAAVWFTGAELAPSWSSEDWLVINPGEPNTNIFSPLEVMGLPGDPGPVSGVTRFSPDFLVAPTVTELEAFADLIVPLVRARVTEARVAFHETGSHRQAILLVRFEGDDEAYERAAELLDLPEVVGIDAEVLVSPLVALPADLLDERTQRLL